MTRRSMALHAVLASVLAASTAGTAWAAEVQQAPTTRGEYLARAADCIACHTVDPALPFAGGVPFKTPFGTIYAPNITPDTETGIGLWSNEAFRRALHEGIRQDGQRLYPAFPYTAYTRMSDADVQAVKDYLFAQRPIRHRVPQNQLMFPFGWRFLLVFWNWFNFDEGRWVDHADRPAEWNRGAYLVEGPGHCAECHTPRNFMQGLSSKSFAGGTIEGWEAFNITPDNAEGIGRWTKTDIVRYLAMGIAPGRAWAAGPMAEVVSNSTQYLSDADLNAMATYLQTLKREPDTAQQSEPAREVRGTPATYIGTVRSNHQHADPQPSGAELYVAHCASCHGWDGRGLGLKPGPMGDTPYPPLLHNSTVGAARANNLVQVILQGVHREARGTRAFMPAFAHALSDEDVAALVNHLRRQFGGRHEPISVDQVRKLRESGTPAP